MMRSVSDLLERLKANHAHTRETPLFNPVFQLSLDVSRELEADGIDLDGIEAMVAELECDAMQNRAGRLRALVAPVAINENLSGFEENLVQASADFEPFKASWERPQLHCVFTAHPTFLLSPGQTSAIAAAASQGAQIDETVCQISGERPAITLDYEHEQAMAAIAHGAAARDKLVARIYRQASMAWPDRWQELSPLPFRFASWVGYDMDGRTDIKWYHSIGFRLTEKAQRLEAYAAALTRIDPNHPLLETLLAAAGFARERAADFTSDLSDPEALSAAANRLTGDHPAKLLSLVPLTDTLDAEAASCETARAIELKTLAAAMRADGLGVGWIHFRINSSQLNNAIRRVIDPDGGLDLSSRGALGRLRDAIASAKPHRSNFAALAIESSTAIRQFLCMAQILHHVDADSPIRMLVAECDQPSTVLAALYFTRLFGVEEKVDISPLFETESALEHGGRLLDALLAEENYQNYVRKRGRLAIQTGFSDAGRFAGQIPASLAIERLQGRLCDAMVANGLTDVAALIFNTHGESMGRGAHPDSFDDRLAWPLSPWAKRRFARAGIALEPEVSFQGGDGYLFFATPELALATLARITENRPAETNADAPTDLFYRRTDLSLDFYRAIRDHQREHLESRTYNRAVTAFGLGLLNSTGSRALRRQSDLAADREMSLSQIRAIPHNAILQQLGYPVNVIAGIGTAAARDYEEHAGLLNDSERGRQLIRLARAANAVSSVKTVAAFGELFNSAYWASRPYRGTETHLQSACEALAEYLVKDDRVGVFRRLASRLRIDAMKFHHLLALIPDENPHPEREHVRRSIGVLQALRLALFQHMFICAVSIPPFSRANDISREDVLEMVFTLRIDEALAQLRRAFPTSFPRLDDFKMDAPTDYPTGGSEGYEGIQHAFIDPIERAYKLSLRISAVIANHFGAHG